MLPVQMVPIYNIKVGGPFLSSSDENFRISFLSSTFSFWIFFSSAGRNLGPGRKVVGTVNQDQTANIEASTENP